MRVHYPLNLQGNEDAGQLPWIDGVPSTGAQGSYPGHAIVTDVEAEILSAIDAAGLARNGSDLTQLIQAVSRGIFLGTFTGSANALVGAIPNNVVMPSLLQGMRFAGVATIANTAGVTVALSGFNPAIGTLPLLRRDGKALAAGDLPLNAPFDFRFDGSAFRVASPTVSELSSSITTSITQTAVVPHTPVQFFTAGTYSWTCPAGVYLIYLKVVGAGASGNCGTSGGGGGGGGAGGSTVGYLEVTPGVTYTIVVGKGGASVTNSANYGGAYGLAGSSSSFGNLASAPGAPAGNTSTASGTQGGTAGTGLINCLPGNFGNDGSPYINGVGGAGGNSLYNGAGRAGTPSGVSATGPGAGGGGSYGPQPGNSGAGADGGIEIQY